MSEEQTTVAHGRDRESWWARMTTSYQIQILLVAFATLLLEISYTRIISYKLFYYFTYLTIGLALLGLGAGGVVVAISTRLRREETGRLVVFFAVAGALAVPLGYLLVSALEIDSLAFWNYGTPTFTNGLVLLAICLAVFASFLPAGIILALLFSRRPDQIGKLYFFDLLGAGLACLIIVPLLARAGPLAAIMFGALAFAGAAWITAPPSLPALRWGAGALSLFLVLGVLIPDTVLPDIRKDSRKVGWGDPEVLYSSWSPLFRVDVQKGAGAAGRILYHDGLPGSLMRPWDGNEASLAANGYETTRQAVPYSIHATPPENIAIIGAAAGNEVQGSIYYGAGHIDAVEINPVTFDLVTDEMADYVGNIADHPRVDYHNADGRTFMARSDDDYDMIWLPAPDSYSATNASTASAFVLTESYLYTSEAIVEYLEHLSPDGYLVAQFGETDYEEAPIRTARFVATVRSALERSGVENAGDHIMVAAAPRTGGLAGVSTIVVSNTPIDQQAIDRFSEVVPTAPEGSRVTHHPGWTGESSAVNKSIELSGNELDAFSDTYPFEINAIHDDRPFFWHFTSFDDVVGNYAEPIDRIVPEIGVGERVLLLLLLIAVALAAVFLLLPFVKIRATMAGLPRKGLSFAYFATIGFAFIILEIALIQRLVLFLGYPTYSLTVTLASLLIFLGLGALLSDRVNEKVRWDHWLPVALIALFVFYLLALTPLTEALLGLPLGARVGFTFLLLGPAGLLLGMFMPLGIRAVSSLTEAKSVYVAWSWAVNGFASVIGSVLATILAMSYGFQFVIYLSLALYVLAMVSLHFLEAPWDGPPADESIDEPVRPETAPAASVELTPETVS